MSVLRLLALLVLVAVVGGSWWWLREQREAPVEAQAERHPDSYFHDLDVTRHDPAGNPEMHLVAEYAEHFEGEPWIYLQQFEATGLADGPGWRLRADTGRLTDDGVHLDATDNVVLSRRDGDAGMRLRTDSLSVNTESQVAQTDDYVILSQGSGVISGRGMWASLADDRLQLESEVKARYGK